jgi:hypothetical protein
MGSAALVIDVGMVIVEKSKLQNAADSAVMAAVMDLPSAGTASSTARSYAISNGVDSSDITVTTPYDGDSRKIKVECKKKVSYTFARVLGFSDTEVTAIAVARNTPWAGDALPFLNMLEYSVGDEIDVWDKVSSGDFMSINDYEMINEKDPDTVYFKLDYMDGIELKKGTVATIKQEIGYIYDRTGSGKVYLVSFIQSVFDTNKVLLTNGSEPILSQLKNTDIVDPSQLILLECDFDEYDIKKKTLKLTVTADYDFYNGEFPPEYEPPDGGGSMLIRE